MMYTLRFDVETLIIATDTEFITTRADVAV